MKLPAGLVFFILCLRGAVFTFASKLDTSSFFGNVTNERNFRVLERIRMRESQIAMSEIISPSIPFQVDLNGLATQETTSAKVDVNLQTISPDIEQKITFNSLSLRDSVVGARIPPDPSGAAGPSSVISVVNSAIQAISRTGTVLWNKSLVDFFVSIRQTTFIFDPKIVYDIHTSKFVVVSLDANFPSPCISNILLAVSTNSNPTASDWTFKKITSLSNGFWADYPGFEVDEEVIYITANMFSCAANTFSNSKLWIVKKSDLSFSAHENFPGYQEGTYMPAEVRASIGAGAGIGTYLLSATYGNFLSIVQIKNPSGTVSFDQKYLPLGNIGTSDSLLADQKGSTQKIAAGDWRSYDAVYDNNFLWVVISRLVGGQPTAIWVQVDVSNWAAPSIVQLGYISGEDISPGTHTFYPSVAVNKDGVAAFGFSASGSNIYAGAYFTWRRPTDTIGTIRPSETVRAGVASYFIDYGSGRNRWGDYTGISVDPANENCFWVYNEFADTSCYSSGSQSGCWTTVWSQFCLKTAVQPAPKPTIPVPKPVRPAPRPTIPVPKPIQPVPKPIQPAKPKPLPKPTISTVLFVLDLKTDDYGSETNWTLTDSVTQKIIAQKPLGSYASKSTYKETASLAAGKYLFTISDSESDGICCDYGNGSYNVTVGGLVFKTGGEFKSSESTPIILLGIC